MGGWPGVRVDGAAGRMGRPGGLGAVDRADGRAVGRVSAAALTGGRRRVLSAAGVGAVRSSSASLRGPFFYGPSPATTTPPSLSLSRRRLARI